jgi:transposase InsO family protein
MSKARLIITAVILEGRSQSTVAREYGVSKGWVSKLVARYRTEGDLAFEPRSRRPKTTPTAINPATVDLIVELREQLVADGLDAGPDTIHWHLEHHHATTVSVSTIARTLTRANLVTPSPKKRPKSSYIRFEADQPNECWQSDFTHYPLADRTDTEILTWLDDHSRYALRITAHQPVTGPAVLTAFRAATAEHGYPASTLTDNGMVFTARFAGERGGRNAFEAELDALGIVQKNSRPNHPTTCGKVERFQQTLKRWLRQQPAPATLVELQALLDTFRTIYNQQRPHRSLRDARLPPPSTPRDPKPPRPEPTTPTTGSDATASTPPASSPSASPANSATSASDEPTPEPTSSSSSTTSTSASSTPPPENSSEHSRSTPPATTNPPAHPKAPPDPKRNAPNPVAGSKRFPSPER